MDMGTKVDGNLYVALVIFRYCNNHTSAPHFEQPSVRRPLLYSKARPQKKALC